MNVISKYNGLLDLHNLSNLYAGKKILLVTGKKSFETSGAKKIMQHHLQDEYVVQFSDFSVNPKIEDATRGARIAKENNIEVIIAIGGGSVLDIAKLIKAFINSSGNEINLVKGKDTVVDSSIPIIAIPTTAGSGSEATHFAVVYVGEDKYSLAAPCLLPNAVILDGALAITGGKYLKSCNALDAMSQAIESYWAAGSTIESQGYSLSSIERGWKTIMNYVSDKCSESDAQNMIESAHLAGKAINISKTTAAHAWSYAFTSIYNIPHGHAVWLTLPAIFEAHLQSNISSITDKRGSDYFQDIMQKLKKTLDLVDSESVSYQLEKFLIQIDMEPKMENLGCDKQVKKIDVSGRVNRERMGNNPVDLTDFVNQIFRME